MKLRYVLHRNNGRGRFVMDGFETIVALAAAPSGLLAMGMATTLLVLLRRGNRRRRRTD